MTGPRGYCLSIATGGVRRPYWLTKLLWLLEGGLDSYLSEEDML